ncbi:hypothetical protein [Cellulomonas taurus]|uniref:hypothetical protein n=1 Tax=Cellulomonas taurus TaxID=2729175 RepID=UPI00145CB9D7|nr:hypothetical protein [Cellulomonas taurus]
MKPVDARAGKVCSNCNYRRQIDNRKHCPSRTCTWWKCLRCGASNDEAGRNSVVDLQGRSKRGA